MTVTMTEFPTENDWAQVKRRALKTCGKKPVTPPTTEWKHAILNARHSPIRRLFFSFDLDDVPYWLSNELCRHHEGVEKYVFSQRNDRQHNYDRNAARQDAPVNLVFDCNAEGLMNVMNKRLCNQASAEMRQLMRKIKDKVLEQFPEFCGLLVPACEYNGVCHEMNPCGRPDGLYSRLIQENEMLKITNEVLKTTIEGLQVEDTKRKRYAELYAENVRLKVDLLDALSHCKAVDEVNEKMKCCGNCKHYVDDNCDLQCPHNCYNYDEWEMKE